MLCKSCQNLNLDQICGLEIGDDGKRGHVLRAQPIHYFKEGSRRKATLCDLCEFVFKARNIEAVQHPVALLSSAEPGVLPISSVTATTEDRSQTLSWEFGVFCSQGNVCSPYGFVNSNLYNR